MVHFFPLKYLFFLERHSYRETQSETVQLLVYVPITVAAGAPWTKPGPEFTLATHREAQAQLFGPSCAVFPEITAESSNESSWNSH